MTSNQRLRYYSGGPWELVVGYCRATRVGDQIFVSGSTAMKDGKLVGAGDPAAQARQTLQTIDEALVNLGSSMADVVRYRAYLVDMAHTDVVIVVFSEVFGQIHPSGTFLAVKALMTPELLIEIEVDAIIGSAAPVG